MANHEWETEVGRTKSDQWVDSRLAALALGREWIPDGGRTFARLHARRRARVVAVRRWIWTTVAAAGAFSALLLLPASRACAEQPGPCVLRLLGARASGTSAPITSSGSPVPSVAPMLSADVRPLPEAIATRRNFKETGSASAAICIEVYTDYECVHCETFVREVTPMLSEQYVRTGKARLLYRDYPLPTHRYAKLAAYYANAAGELGYYDTAMKQLFVTRQAWSVSGDIDTQIAQVLPVGIMEKLRDRMKNDADPDAALAADLAAGQEDRLDRVPFVVIVSGGKRQRITETPLSFDVLKSNLDRISEAAAFRDHGNMTIDETTDCGREIQSHVPCHTR